MPDYNRVILMGRLTRDPELKHTANNSAVCTFGLATGRKYKTGSGEMREDTLFIDCVAWSKTGEAIAQYLTKGKPILVEGYLKLDQWEDKEGNRRSKISVSVDRFSFVDSGGGESKPKPEPQGNPVAVDHDPLPF